MKLIANTLVCVFLGSAALAATDEKCPAVPDGMMGTCVEACTSNSDCTQDEICCSNGCGHSCIKAPGTVVDDSRCPKPSGMGTCAEECSTDGSDPCPDGQICCSNGCGHTCHQLPKPETVKQDPRCPSTDGMMGTCVQGCTQGTNNGCTDKEICCSNGCGTTCISEPQELTCPVREEGVVGQCIEECEEDSHCIPPRNRCCFNGCGHFCEIGVAAQEDSDVVDSASTLTLSLLTTVVYYILN